MVVQSCGLVETCVDRFDAEVERYGFISNCGVDRHCSNILIHIRLSQKSSDSAR